MLGEDLLVLATEHILPSKLRIDILALDTNANVVVVELKRDWSGTDIDCQAIKYASYCSSLTVNQLCELLSKREGIDLDSARARIEEFIDEEIVDEDLKTVNQDQRLILVAREYDADVVSSVLWLREYEIDVRCVRLRCFADQDGTLFLNPEVIIPLPEAETITVRREAKGQQRRKATEHVMFSLDREDLPPEKLAARLCETLNRSESRLTPRFIAFLELLLSEQRAFNREEIKQALLTQGIGRDIGQSGRFLSNLSQFLTNKTNAHLRQLITFDGGTRQGQLKDNYKILPEYRELVRAAIQSVKSRTAVNASAA